MPVATSNTSLTTFPTRLLLLTLWLSLFSAATTVYAQTDDLTLSVRRIFGYGGGDQIQGNFRLEATGPAGLASVTFKIDETVVAVDDAPPFRVDFNTDDHDLGWHDLIAVGETSDGRALISAPRRFEFVSEDESWRAAGEILWPILTVAGVVIAIGLGVPLAQALRGKPAPIPPGAPRRYGLMGGAICPECGRPFPRHWWGLNAGLGKYDRCDNCGRWSIVRAEPLEKLRAAEAAEIEPATVAPELTPEEKLRRQLDESKYSDEA
jgi:hypothetical protein